MSRRLNEVARWHKAGCKENLQVRTVKRTVTLKGTSPWRHRGKLDPMLEEELAILDDDGYTRQPVMLVYNLEIDGLSEIFGENEDEDEYDYGLGCDELADLIYIADRYACKKASSEGKQLLAKTREYTYFMSYSAEMYAIYLFEARQGKTFMKVLPSGLNTDAYENVLSHTPWVCI